MVAAERQYASHVRRDTWGKLNCHRQIRRRAGGRRPQCSTRFLNHDLNLALQLAVVGGGTGGPQIMLAEMFEAKTPPSPPNSHSPSPEAQASFHESRGRSNDCARRHGATANGIARRRTSTTATGVRIVRLHRRHFPDTRPDKSSRITDERETQPGTRKSPTRSCEV